MRRRHTPRPSSMICTSTSKMSFDHRVVTSSLLAKMRCLPAVHGEDVHADSHSILIFSHAVQHRIGVRAKELGLVDELSKWAASRRFVGISLPLSAPTQNPLSHPPPSLPSLRLLCLICVCV
mmetsp:Transcript_20613/g.52995  ORF Transcript_20613/g.52995 Transcript_20613/m.52995 type:complete len:122 (-) Transcript_20613:1204-1569(-)